MLRKRRCLDLAYFYNARPLPHLVARPRASPPSLRSAPPSLSARKHCEPHSRVTWPQRRPCLLRRAPGPPFGADGQRGARTGLPGSHVGGGGGLGFLTCIPGTWTATGEWAMKATAVPRCFG